VQVEDEFIEVVTAREDLQKVAEYLEGEGLKPESVNLAMIPQHYVDLSVDDQVKVMRLIETLEDLDDVQEIFTNVEFSDEAVAAI
jgi:transcriptional/translational regulatory protein YebC/TACO1